MMQLLHMPLLQEATFLITAEEWENYIVGNRVTQKEYNGIFNLYVLSFSWGQHGEKYRVNASSGSPGRWGDLNYSKRIFFNTLEKRWEVFWSPEDITFYKYTGSTPEGVYKSQESGETVKVEVYINPSRSIYESKQ